jgi:hypothetical protein
MKQRSLKRSTTPKKAFPECIRSRYIKQSFDPKPCSQGSRDLKRNFFKEFYKRQKSKDKEVGLKIDSLFAEFFEEREYIEEKRKEGKEIDEETIKFLAKLATDIKTLQEKRRFRDDFPSFAAFYRYIRKESITLKDLEDL